MNAIKSTPLLGLLLLLAGVLPASAQQTPGGGRVHGERN